MQARTGSHALLCKLQYSGSSCMFERGRILFLVYLQHNTPTPPPLHLMAVHNFTTACRGGGI